MIISFILAMVFTLFVIRIGSLYLHDGDAYENRKWKGAKYDKSKSLTGFLRRKLEIDVHHFHFGIIILVLIIPVIFLTNLNDINLIILGVGLSMFLDQISGVLFDVEYFGKRSLIISISLHIISIILFYIIIFR